eukprot:CAMPEP_0197032096 /NCGR_PEP_ID=MMETSP1384-20130603/10853_1 /TAXON_ID=29189 /ORGANISM="Ammonia sp." /LENGTH=554 /DNA_ID=CAMNT_0042461701 /DNA_START=27 /DNA_END=1691 /DNA_ORIENTATION=-
MASSSIKALVASTLITNCFGGYWKLEETWSGADFFSHFNFITSDDPTHGYVDYSSSSSGLAFYDSTTDSIFLKTDTASTPSSSSRGRKAIRLESITRYDTGLFIFDAVHIPYGCGVWPAFWTFGPSWPDNGEIDVIEEVNDASYTGHTLHTSNNCDFTSNDPSSQMEGTWSYGQSAKATNCWVNDPEQYTNQGCSVRGRTGTFGSSWNSGGGGVAILLLDKSEVNGIKIWMKKRSNIPDIIYSSEITTAQMTAFLGTPDAYFPFGSHCPSSSFNTQRLTINTALCGDWAGGVWSSSGCATSTGYGSCSDFVRWERAQFSNAYWQIKYLKIFSYSSGTPSGGTGTTSSTTTSTTSSGSGSSSAVSLTVRENANNWWVAIQIDGSTWIDGVKIQGANWGSSWATCSYNSWGSANVWTCQNVDGKTYDSVPLKVVLTSNEGLVAYADVYSTSSGSSYSSGTFNSAYTAEDDAETASKLKWTVIVAFVIVALLVVLVIAGIGYCGWRRMKMNKAGRHSVAQDDEVMMENQVSHEAEEMNQEIEIEAEVVETTKNVNDA